MRSFQDHMAIHKDGPHAGPRDSDSQEHRNWLGSDRNRHQEVPQMCGRRVVLKNSLGVKNESTEEIGKYL